MKPLLLLSLALLLAACTQGPATHRSFQVEFAGLSRDSVTTNRSMVLGLGSDGKLYDMDFHAVRIEELKRDESMFSPGGQVTFDIYLDEGDGEDDVAAIKLAQLLSNLKEISKASRCGVLAIVHTSLTSPKKMQREVLPRR